MPLRSEVVHWLRQCDLSWEALIFADDLFGPQSKFRAQGKTVQLILVDCHAATGALQQQNWPIKEVIDHHPINSNSPPEHLDQCDVKSIELVGSCASLVTSQLLKNRRGESLPFVVWKLLYGKS